MFLTLTILLGSPAILAALRLRPDVQGEVRVGLRLRDQQVRVHLVRGQLTSTRRQRGRSAVRGRLGQRVSAGVAGGSRRRSPGRNSAKFKGRKHILKAR
jgi:hypothetical protein